MNKVFNINGDCKPGLHYMVDISEKLSQIKSMIDDGKYFTINRARQYGKTTTLRALKKYLQEEYIVVSLDFQKLGANSFETENAFSVTFAKFFLNTLERNSKNNGNEIKNQMNEFEDHIRTEKDLFSLFELFISLSKICEASDKPVVLLIDEVDTASNNQVFLDFLAQLRGYYIDRDETPTFQSVILAGVYDIKSLKIKIRTEDVHKTNSPWITREDNEPCESLLSFGDCPRDHMILVSYDIAADFDLDMSLSENGIAGMLEDYEQDHHTGMNSRKLAALIYDYTSGYPYLVSRICKLLDERVAGSEGFPDKSSAWTREGLLKAVRILLSEPNMLFDSLLHKLKDYPELDWMLHDLLFMGREITYVIGISSMEMALMFGFARVEENQLLIANRIFESFLYNLYLASPEMQQEEIYDAAMKDRNQFIENGHLDMKLVLERFVRHFDDLYGDQGQKFYEEDGRRYFMLFLKPIINGQGNCYVEAETRNRERTDLIVDYHGERFIVEVKLWYGAARHAQGEKQLAEYLEHYHLHKGYLLTFNFNRNKETGVKEVIFEDKILIEAVV